VRPHFKRRATPKQIARSLTELSLLWSKPDKPLAKNGNARRAPGAGETEENTLPDQCITTAAECNTPRRGAQ